MNIQRLSYALIAFLVISLSACGGSTGGGDDAGPGGDPDDPDVVNPDPGGLVNPGVSLVAEQNSLPSNAVTTDNGVQLTAIIRDANNNVVSGQAVSFSADSGALQVTQSTTDDAGTATAVLTTGGNPQNRVINVTATSGSGSDALQINVVGTTLALTGPSALALNDTGIYTAILNDAGGNGINNRAVTVTSAVGNTIGMTSSSTDVNGQLQFSVTANQSGTDTLTASALGLNAQTMVEVAGDNFQIISPNAGTQVELNTPQIITLRWLNDGNNVNDETITFSTTRGTFVGGNGDVTVNGEASVQVQSNNAGPATITATSDDGLTTNIALQFIAVSPDNIAVQADPATVSQRGQSTITAVVRDPNNNLVTGAVVNFTLDDTSGGSLRDGSATTDTRGVASTVYTAGNTTASSPAIITASVNGTVISDTAQVTVGGQALRIVLGTGNELEEPTTTTYRQPYVAIVTDAAGNPAPDASFTLSVRALAYQKGEKVRTFDADGNFVRWAPDYNVPVPASPNTNQFGCLNEDANQNGILDVDQGEDFDGDGRLDPGNVATVPSTVTIDANGTAEFGITYPQDRSEWVEVRLRAVASVQGTETTEDGVFTLRVLADDVDDEDIEPPGQESPFGTAGITCDDAS